VDLSKIIQKIMWIKMWIVWKSLGKALKKAGV
jgi:hypothetical protein